MKIFIPSSNRVGVFNKFTGKLLLDTGLEPLTTIIVPQSQVDMYRKGTSYEVLGVPDRFKGIGRARQYCLDHYKDGEQFVFQLDDDITLDYQHNNRKTTRATPTQVRKCFDVLLELLETETYHQVACGMRYMYQQRSWTREDACASRLFGINTLTMSLHNIRFDTLPLLMEDVFVSLSFITKGYHNYFTDRWLITGGSVNAKGGCSDYRDKEAIEKHIKVLEVYFPGLVTRYVRSNKSWEEGTPNARIAWKKAYNWKKNNEQLNLF